MEISGFNKEETVAINTFIDIVLEHAEKKAKDRGEGKYTDNDVVTSLFEFIRELPE
jgi:hypothetical protein